MSLNTAEKQKLIETHQVHATDTGSVEVQIAMVEEGGISAIFLVTIM